MFKAGELPCRHQQFPTGTIIVFPDEDPNLEGTQVAIYARVSSHDQKEDLKRQLNRLRTFAAAKGLSIEVEKSEIGSGLNGNRPGLCSLLRDNTVTAILVEHRDRLARFGIEYLEEALRASGRRLIVVNKTEHKDDLTQDFFDVVTSMCTHIYGKRAAKNRAKRAIEAAKKP